MSVDFVDIERYDETILLDIRYATTNNFTKQVLYSSPKCFLRKKVAFKLLPIQDKLRRMGLSLKIFDAYRPLSIQKKLWEIVPDTRYVADPELGSNHNRGASLDVTLVDLQGRELTMPTPFDNFTEKAHRDHIDMPLNALANRELLEKIMKEQGFIPLPTEWWHFDDEEWETYPLEDLSISELEVTCGV